MSNIFDLFAQISGSGSAVPAKQAPVEWIIAGLGNPGKDYVRTRHNIGFLCMDVLARKMGVTVDRLRFHALTAQTEIGGHGVLLMCPQTFMNLSGEAVREAAAYYKVAPEHVLVLVDDINLDLGRLRVRADGTDGGHNGLKNIIYQLNSDRFPRIRIGAGKKPHPDMVLTDWVLARFTEPELDQLLPALECAAAGAELIVSGKTEEAMRLCNGRH